MNDGNDKPEINSGTWWGRPHQSGSTAIWLVVRVNGIDGIIVFSPDNPHECNVVQASWFVDLGLQEIPPAHAPIVLRDRLVSFAAQTLEHRGVTINRSEGIFAGQPLY